MKDESARDPDNPTTTQPSRMPTSHRAFRSPRGLLLAALLTLSLLLAWLSSRSRPQPAWPEPVDLSQAQLPLLSLETPAEGLPVMVLRPEPAGSPSFSDYLAELLRMEGLSVALRPCSSPLPPPPAGPTALFLPEGCQLPANPTLEAFVSAGGSLILMGAQASREALMGAQVLAPASPPTLRGPLPLGVATVRLETAQPWPLEGLNGTTAQPASPRIFGRRLGQGQVWTVNFDLPRTVARLRQGDPARANQKGLLPHPCPADLFQAQVDPASYRLPRADMLTQALVELASSSARPVPRFWSFPSPASSALIMTGDQDFAPDELLRFEAERVEEAGGELTFFLTAGTRRDQADPATASSQGPPDEATARDLLRMHHGLSIHPNANGLPRSLESFAQVLSTARQAVQRRYGVTPRTLRNHFVFWTGYVDAARVFAEQGILMDLNYNSVFPAARAPGWLTGSGKPAPLVDETGALVPILQQATQLEDDLLLGDYAFSARLSETQALAWSGKLLQEALSHQTALTVNVHPLYAIKFPAFLRGILQEARSRQVPILSAERWLWLNLRRLEARVSQLSWEGSQIRFEVRVPGGSLWMYLPLRGGQSCQAATLDGRALSLRPLETTRGKTGLLFQVPAGIHQLEIDCGPSDRGTARQ